MTITFRKTILRADAFYLLAASAGGLGSRMAGGAPHAGIGFFAAHGFAGILSILLWRARSLRPWHVTGAAVHILLGTANLVLWPVLAHPNLLWGSCWTTSLHWLLALPQLLAATAPPHGACGPTVHQSCSADTQASAHGALEWLTQC